jgi:hypothetical protein
MAMNRISKFVKIARLLPRLGWINIFRVARHRFLLKLGVHPVCKLGAEILHGTYFTEPEQVSSLKASDAWKSTIRYFDWFEVQIVDRETPNWFGRPLSGGDDWPSDQPWWKANGSFGVSGDIKEIWDLSRFNWVLAMAQRASNGDSAELQRLNDWLSDWSKNNPPYYGPNWACGQEASIRVMHLAIAAVILHQESKPTVVVLSFLKAHLARIEATLGYAISQDNNHGVLEASGLFVGGEWLHKATGDLKAREWANLGRKWLEERTRRLISEDGGFSMYSVAYHREFLDALTICEFWRVRFDLPDFSSLFQTRTNNAALWLKAFTHPVSGDAPNIGANDGTRLMPLSDTGYRDFRPSVQLACALFCRASAYGADGLWNLPLLWLGVPLPKDTLPKEQSKLFDACGFAVLHGPEDTSDTQVFVRYPRFRFRPSHADALHVDLWINGVNVLRDGGSFSYNLNSEYIDYFTGVESHNTIQFDGEEQMPRLGIFLLGDWLRAKRASLVCRNSKNISFSAEYVGRNRVFHHRRVDLNPGKLVVIDRIIKFSKVATLRWRLSPGDWKIDGHAVVSREFRLEVSSNVKLLRFEIVNGFESLCYGNKVNLSVLEAEFEDFGVITTTILWQ